MKNTVLVIGAGAAGLMAAHALCKAGKKVTILEARNRTGGRIYTLNSTSFFKHTELGAEFIHGDLPVTLGLLKEANIPHRTADAEMWRYENGKFTKDNEIIEDWELLIARLNELTDDTTINQFLEQEFAGDKYSKLRDGVWKFVSGYDTADPRLASAFALRNEWQHEDENAQHRINGGYCALISYLVDECKKTGNEVLLNSVAKHIDWKPDDVKVTCADGSAYHAEKLVIAIPLGVLKAGKDESGAINFAPQLPDYSNAIGKMGFGAVIKILLEFNEPFWLDKQSPKTANDSIKKMGYLFSDEEIPTWWTQAPNQSKVLTGWIGGPAAQEKLHTPDAEILEQGLQSLANIFDKDINELKGMLVARRVVNWTADPFTRGSYAYDTVDAPQARRLLNKPVNDTIFFAGEYLYEDTAMGTVEAALTNGLAVAKKILDLVAV